MVASWGISSMLWNLNLLLAVIGTLVIGVPVGILANAVGPYLGIGELPSASLVSPLTLVLIVIITTALGLLILRRAALGGILRSAALELSADEEIEVLIIGLSPLFNAHYKEVLESGPIEHSFEDMSKDVRSFQEWAKQCVPSPPSPEWQQAWRAIAARRKTLQKVLVVPSPESAPYFRLFKRRTMEMLNEVHDLKHLEISLAVPDVYRGIHIDIQINSKLFPNYTDYNQTHRALRHAIKLAGVPNSKICIDYTSGNSTFSIAAVAITINTEIRIQYIETGTRRFAEVGAEEPTIVDGGWPHIYKFGLELPSAS